jgi:hypothetical protein
MASEITSFRQQPRFICDYQTIRSLNEECDQILDKFEGRGLFDQYCGPYAAWIALRLMGKNPDAHRFFSRLPVNVKEINERGSYSSEIATLLGCGTSKQIFMEKNLNNKKIDRLLGRNKPVIVLFKDDEHFANIIGSDQDYYYVLDYHDICSVEKTSFRKSDHQFIYAGP